MRARNSGRDSSTASSAGTNRSCSARSVLCPDSSPAVSPILCAIGGHSKKITDSAVRTGTRRFRANNRIAGKSR